MSLGGLELVATALVLFALRLALPHAFVRSRGYDTLILVVSAAIAAAWQPLGLLVTAAMVLALVGWLQLTNRPDRARSVPFLWLAVTLLLAPLVVFKYVPWVSQQLGMTSWPWTTWVVPLGLSFTTFRLIGVAVDRHALRLSPDPLRVAVMGLFFPTFQAGPITGLQTFGPLPGDQSASAQWREAGGRILTGLLRKVVLADLLYATVVSRWLKAGPAGLTPEQALVLPILLGLYIYWDFAGYSDIAIGTAALAGYKVPENFNRPYFSGSLTEFWRRWHITLSEWIRLRLTMKMVNRRSPMWHFSIATLASMVLCGLWHGAGLNFIAWGLWHGVGLVTVQGFAEAQRRLPRLARWCQSVAWTHASVGLTFAFVTAGWIVFFLPLDEGLALLARAGEYRPAAGTGMAAAAALGLGTIYLLGTWPSRAWTRMPVFVRGVLVSMAGALVTYVLVFRASGSQEFVYSQF